MRTLPSGLFLGVLASFALVFDASAQNPGEIITYAGNGYGAPNSGGYSGDGGPATNAEFFSPVAVVADKFGNLFIADGNNFCVRKVTASTQIVSTVAGVCTVSGYSGDGGLATSAELSFPSALALDGTGNLYIADTSNYRIRKVAASTGVITTVAGDGTQGDSGDGGLATNAQLGRPSGIAVDAAGNIYVADPYSNTVRKVTASTGIISLVAGGAGASYPAGDGGPASAASLNQPGGIALDGAGNLYILDQNNAVVRKVTASSGIITTVAGNNTWGFSGDGGQATKAQLNDAGGIAVDSAGNLYIADTFNYRIRKVTTGGIISTIAGTGTAGFSGDGGPATTAASQCAFGRRRERFRECLHRRHRKQSRARGVSRRIDREPYHSHRSVVAAPLRQNRRANRPGYRPIERAYTHWHRNFLQRHGIAWFGRPEFFRDRRFFYRFSCRRDGLADSHL